MEKAQNYSLSDLAQMLGIEMSTARMLGKPALLSQLLEVNGLEHVTRCDDCQNSDRYTGDDEADLRRVLEGGV